MTSRSIAFILCLISICLCQCKPEAGENNQTLSKDTDAFLEQYTSTLKGLYYAAAEAEWKLNTYIVEGDTITGQQAEQANQALADFTGSKENIEKARKFLEGEMEKFFFGEGSAPPEGYVDPDAG